MSSLSSSSLLGLIILERDINNEIQPWAFPSIEKAHELILRGRSGLGDTELESPGFRFSKYKQTWQYFYTVPFTPPSSSSSASRVAFVSIIVLSSSYNPLKFADLLIVLHKIFATEASAPPVLEAYLSAYTTGVIGTSFSDSSYDVRRALVGPISKLLHSFQTDIVHIWTAMLLKKRVIVRHDTVTQLLDTVRAMPLAGTWHRQHMEILRPYVRNTPAEISDLSSAGVYVAGVTDSSFSSMKNLYDIFVDVPARSILIADHAQQDFTLTKFQKNTVEQWLTTLNQDNDQTIIKNIALSTKTLLDNILSLRTADESGQLFITNEGLAQQKLPQNMDKFIYNVAMAEGLIKK